MSRAEGIARIALLIAAIGSIAAAALLAGASLGISMEGANLHPTPRINAFTVGLGLVPVPAFAWIVYLWTRTRPSRFPDVVLRIVVSGAILVVAGYCLLTAYVTAIFVF